MDFAGPEIRDAVALALQLADFKEQKVDAYDPDHLWKNAFGTLG